MKFMLMMNAPKGDGDWGISKWAPEDLKAHIGFMKTFTGGLAAAGELVGAEGLAMPAQAKLVRAGKDRRPITDGVFPESKEFLAGYWIVDVDSPGARLPDRGGSVSRPRQRRRAAQHADRGARSDERAAGRGVTRASAEFTHENLLRELAPQVLGAVIRRFGDFGAAEDAVQEALLAAALQWPKEGLPDNPRGWLIQVAARRVTDHLRSESARRRRETVAATDPSQLRSRHHSACRSLAAFCRAAVEGRFDATRAGRHARSALHVLSSLTHIVIRRRSDAARGRRSDDCGDRQSISRPRIDDGAADQPGEAEHQDVGRAVQYADARRARRATDRRPARALSDLQRGIHELVRQASAAHGALERSHPAGAGAASSCCPTNQKLRGCWR